MILFYVFLQIIEQNANDRKIFLTLTFTLIRILKCKSMNGSTYADILYAYKQIWSLFFPFYNMKKIKWRYFFYPIYIWFNNKLLVAWLIYLGHLKKDIDIPFSFFFSSYSVKRVLMLLYWLPFYLLGLFC